MLGTVRENLVRENCLPGIVNFTSGTKPMFNSILVTIDYAFCSALRCIIIPISPLYFVVILLVWITVTWTCATGSEKCWYVTVPEEW